MASEIERPWQSRIMVGGFQPFSTIDWPGQVAAVVFLSGCPWRCHYCHNPDLQARPGAAQADSLLAWASIEAALDKRRGWLDGVVFSGGEATADRALPEAIEYVRSMGFKVGLHTGGAYPERLAKLLPLLDWVGLDFKTEPNAYPALTGVPGSGGKACRSAHLVATSGLPYEFRLTYHSALITEASLHKVFDYAQALGCEHFVLQEYRSVAGLQHLPHLGVSGAVLEEAARRFAKFSFRAAN